ncbi:MAG: hypothetical protein HY270_08930 [Deltaproteobacteria bacterium]|nr:hypothetical protein [Deltaproteobacteria bacterium]
MHRLRACCALAIVLLVALRLKAMTLIPLSIEELTQSAQAVVIADVIDIVSEATATSHIHTLVHIAIAGVVAGEIAEGDLTLVESGGSIGDEVEVVDAAPRFTVGEKVVLFLVQGDDGAWHTNQMVLGKFDIIEGAAGRLRALQQLPSDTTVLLPAGIDAPQSTVDLQTLLASIREAASGALPTFQENPTSNSFVPELTAAFTLGGTGLPGRFFEPDQNTPLSFLIDQRGDSILGLTASRRAVDAAFAAWTQIDGASIDLRDGGLTTDLSPACPGPNPLIVRFDDPLSEIPAPVGCHGMLAVGGFRARNSETKVFNNTTFGHSLCATLTFADGWGSCDVWTECNLGEIATHELGHSIGLAHSSERNPEPDATLRDATMYFQAHFDGRCAGVRSDDIAGVTFIYPTAAPPTITTPDVLPSASEGQAYSLQLAASGGSGGFTWSLTRQTNLTGLNVSANGILSGTPVASGAGTKSLLIRAGDTVGNAHTKLFTLQLLTPAPSPSASATPPVSPTPSATESATPSATEMPSTTPSFTQTAPPTRTPSATPPPTASTIPSLPPTSTATPLPCPGDCDGSTEVTVDEIIRLVNIALGAADLETCRAGDLDHSGEITVDEIIMAVNSALNGCGR